MDKEIKNIEEEKEIEEMDPLLDAKATLMFTRDPRNENWISRLSNGKIVLLHRSCDVVPWPGVEYLCTIQEKESHALSWILGVYQYPRVVVKADETCILIETPEDKPKAVDHIYDALRAIDSEYVFVLYRKENKIPPEDATQSINREERIINFELKLTEQNTKNVWKVEFEMPTKRILNLKEIANNIERKIKEGG